MSWVIGVDVGGTFTDFYAINTASGETRLEKVASTPANPADAILTGLAELQSKHGVDLMHTQRLAHGTTVATNCLIQRKGAKVAVLTTAGFRDLLEIGRQIRPHMYDMHTDFPPPLSSRENRLEVEERILADGTVHRELSEKSLSACLDTLQGLAVESVAVCFLFSYLNPSHELSVAGRLRERLPDLRVSLSSQVQPEFREFERFSTTTINAYLQPVLDHYVSRLEETLADILPGASIGINQSSGGLMSLARTREFPVRTALSGPAAGVVGAASVGVRAQRPDLITLDVGGTSADVALIRDGHADIRFDRDVAGFPIRLPMVDIHTIGAGGGSIAWFDQDDLLKVGPLSAGAAPGPACYGQGGTEPTVSDANLVLGRLSPQLADGALELDRTLAEKSLQPFAQHLQLSLQETAHGVLKIMIANMVRALRTISVERGHDPRSFCLMPFGGAGPLQAREVAQELGIKEILVPPAPGIICAEGLIVSDLKEDFVEGAHAVVEEGGLERLEQAAITLQRAAQDWLDRENIEPTIARVDVQADMRFVGQNFELRIPLAGGAASSGLALPSAPLLRQRFTEAHELAYGFASKTDAIEIVNVRLTARAKLMEQPELSLPTRGEMALEPSGVRDVVFDSTKPAISTPIYQRGDLMAGDTLVGPAIIEQLDSTIPHYPGDVATVLESGALLMEITDERF